MILQLPCPGCGLVLGVDDRLAGGAVICSRCQRTVGVPAPAPGGPPAPYPYPYPFPGYAGGPAPVPGAADPAFGFRIAGGVVGIVASLIFMSTAVGAIGVFEPQVGSGGAGLLAIAAFGICIWGVVVASLACTRRRWAQVASVWTQIALVAVSTPSFIVDLVSGIGSSELRDVLRVAFPITVILSGASASFGLLAVRRGSRR